MAPRRRHEASVLQTVRDGGMQPLLRRWAGFVVAHAWLVLAGALVASALVGAGALRLTANLDLEHQLPADNPYIALDRRLRAEFGGKNFVAIAIVPQEGTVWRRDVLQVVHDVTRELLDAPGVIRQNVASLSSPYVRVPRTRGDVLSVEYLMREVPTDDAGVAALRAVYLGEPLFRGTVVSRDERAAMVLADFYDDTPTETIYRAIHAVVDAHRSPDLRIALSGRPIVEVSEAAVMDRQRAQFGGTFLAILLVLYLAFGQLQGVVIPSATALLSTLWSLGFMGHAGIPLTAWTAGAPMLVVTVAAGHSAQMLKRYYEEFTRLGSREAAIVESTSRIGLVMLAAGAIAGAGFAALAILRIPSLTEFGFGVAAGILAAVVLEMTFMLALRTLWRAGRRTRGEGPLSRWLDRPLRRFWDAAAHRPRRVVVASVVAVVLTVAGLPRLRTEFVVRDYRSPRTEIGRDLPVFEEHFPDTTTLTVLLEGPPGSMQTPEAMRLMRGLTETMAAVEGVGRTSSLADFIQRTLEVFAPDRAAGGLPDDAGLIAQLFFLSDSPAFERYVDRAYSRSVVLGFLGREDSALVRRVIDRLEAYLRAEPPRTIRVSLAGGSGPTILAFNEHTVRGKALNITIVLLVIFALSSLLLRTARGGAYMIVPLVVALLMNFGLFAWLGVAFDVVGATIAAVAVGIGADYAIYFLYRLREQYRECGDIEAALRVTMDSSGRAVLFVALAVSAGFAVNVVSDFRALQLMGWFVPVTMLVSCLTTLTLLPSIVVLRRPAFIFRRAATSLPPPPERRQAVG